MTEQDYVEFDCNGYKSCGHIVGILKDDKGRKIYLIEDYKDGSHIEVLESYVKESNGYNQKIVKMIKFMKDTGGIKDPPHRSSYVKKNISLR